MIKINILDGKKDILFGKIGFGINP